MCRKNPEATKEERLFIEVVDSVASLLDLQESAKALLPLIRKAKEDGVAAHLNKRAFRILCELELDVQILLLLK